jgi:hypothetical protein
VPLSGEWGFPWGFAYWGLKMTDLAGRLEALALVAGLSQRMHDRAYTVGGKQGDWYKALSLALLALAEAHLPSKP